MITGHWLRRAAPTSTVNEPRIDGQLIFPRRPGTPAPFYVDFLIDSGSSNSFLGPTETALLSQYVAIARLPNAPPTIGVGGQVHARTIAAQLTFPGNAVNVSLPALRLLVANPRDPTTVSPQQAQIPSLLGRDVLSQFALFLDESAGKVRLLEAVDIAQLLFANSPLR